MADHLKISKRQLKEWKRLAKQMEDHDKYGEVPLAIADCLMEGSTAILTLISAIETKHSTLAMQTTKQK